MAGHVFIDANGNGAQGGGETGAAGLAVTLTPPYGGSRTTTTDANGDYSFVVCPQGPEQWTSTTRRAMPGTTDTTPSR